MKSLSKTELYESCYNRVQQSVINSDNERYPQFQIANDDNEIGSYWIQRCKELCEV